MGLDTQRRLVVVVVANSVAYAHHLRMAAAIVTGRLNRLVPEADLAGVVVVMRPVNVLVVTAAEFTDHSRGPHTGRVRAPDRRACAVPS
jgi:hypothetical protein